MLRRGFRYFLAPDTGGDGGDGGIEDVFIDEGEGNYEEEIFMVDGLDEIPPEEEKPLEDSPEMAALKEQNAVLLSQVANLSTQADSTTALREGIASLGETLHRPLPGPAVPPVDPVEAKKNFNTKWFDDPQAALEQYEKEKLGPQLRTLASTNVQYAKEFLILDKERSPVYLKYKDEVDQVFSQFPPQKQFTEINSYKEAADIVASRHISETIASMEETIRAKILKELKDGNSNAKPVYSESGVNPTPPPGGSSRAVVLPKKVWEVAGIQGIQGRGESQDKARVHRLWKEGKLRVPGVPYKG